MASPSHTAHGVPASPQLRTGWKTTLEFALNPTVSLFIKEVTPADWDGGEPIPNTTFQNVNVHTNAPRVLVKEGPIKMVVEYSLDFLTEIKSLINKEGSCTINYPDGSYEDFFGNLQKFTRGALSEAGEPTAEVIINVTNWDPTNHVEARSVYTTHIGTGENP